MFILLFFFVLYTLVCIILNNIKRKNIKENIRLSIKWMFQNLFKSLSSLMFKKDRFSHIKKRGKGILELKMNKSCTRDSKLVSLTGEKES